ncbi:EVE domain-containing protein [Zunongwangia pacifica]|uniref:EVE domain-containing protein n=1 Tax=Zunongwangia pacifica TaxID=2911062 RepID=A0A9X2CPF8_9FLAO|nr:EVE domain-containing protein [Zunongwangia pacifica]MCL6218043.1 EVE domain-containing protein [Zunongwangia pacifica]
MKQGDYIIFYSSKEKINPHEKCQKFTGIGKLPDDKVF